MTLLYLNTMSGYHNNKTEVNKDTEKVNTSDKKTKNKSIKKTRVISCPRGEYVFLYR